MWEKPPDGLGSETKLQVITRAHHSTKSQPHKVQKRVQGVYENNNYNRRKVNLKNNNIGKRRGGGYDVKVFDTRNKQSSYSIKDGFIDTEKIPPHLVEVRGVGNELNMMKRKNGIYRQNIHPENSNVSFGDTDIPTTTAFRSRHLGNGRIRSQSSTLATHQFNKRNHHRKKLDYKSLENIKRIRNRG